MKQQPVVNAIKRWLARYGESLPRMSQQRVFTEAFRAGWKAHQTHTRRQPQRDGAKNG